jgi:hypothetical protein
MPGGRSSNFATFAYQEVSRLYGEPFAFVIAKLHCRDIRCVDATPLHVHVAQVRDSRHSTLMLTVEHLPESGVRDLADGHLPPAIR